MESTISRFKAMNRILKRFMFGSALLCLTQCGFPLGVEQARIENQENEFNFAKRRIIESSGASTPGRIADTSVQGDASSEQVEVELADSSALESGAADPDSFSKVKLPRLTAQLNKKGMLLRSTVGRNESNVIIALGVYRPSKKNLGVEKFANLISAHFSIPALTHSDWEHSGISKPDEIPTEIEMGSEKDMNYTRIFRSAMLRVAEKYKDNSNFKVPLFHFDLGGLWDSYHLDQSKPFTLRELIVIWTDSRLLSQTVFYVNQKPVKDLDIVRDRYPFLPPH